MKHEANPAGDALDIGLRFGAAAGWFVLLAPAGLLVAILFVWLFA